MDYSSRSEGALAAARDDRVALYSGRIERCGGLLRAAPKAPDPPVSAWSRVHASLSTSGIRPSVRDRGFRSRGKGGSLSYRSGGRIPDGVVEYGDPFRVLPAHNRPRAFGVQNEK